jgi:hypothetical protein
MTYTAGSNILASDYNTFSANLNTVWNALWGQSSVGTVSASGTVTATQWATLASTITNAYIHEAGVNPSVASPSAGNNIAIIANLTTSVTYIQANPYNCYASSFNASIDNVAPAKGSGSAAWSITWTQSLNFASGTARTYWFNAGGRIFLTFTKTSTGQLMDPTWNALAAACNQISFTSTSTSKVIAGVTYQGTNKQGGSGTATTIATNIGYAQLTGSNQLIFLQYYPSAPYTDSYIAVYAALVSNTVQFQTVWNQPANNQPYEPVNISAGSNTTLSFYTPEVTYISNTWGSITASSSVS